MKKKFDEFLKENEVPVFMLISVVIILTVVITCMVIG